MDQPGLCSPYIASSQPTKMRLQKKSWPSVRLSSGPASPRHAGHSSGGPVLSNRTRHTARRQWRRGCGLISLETWTPPRARFRFRWAPSRRRHICFAPLLVLPSSPPTKLQTSSDHTVVQGSSNGDPGSPLRPAAARPARAVRRVPGVVVQEGVHRQGQLQPSRQGLSPTCCCLFPAELIKEHNN